MDGNIQFPPGPSPNVALEGKTKKFSQGLCVEKKKKEDNLGREAYVKKHKLSLTYKGFSQNFGWAMDTPLVSSVLGLEGRVKAKPVQSHQGISFDLGSVHICEDRVRDIPNDNPNQCKRTFSPK